MWRDSSALSISLKTDYYLIISHHHRQNRCTVYSMAEQVFKLLMDGGCVDAQENRRMCVNPWAAAAVTFLIVKKCYKACDSPKREASHDTI